MRGKHATDLAIPALAAHQHGVISRAQLRTAGLHDRAIDRRIAAGRLHPVYRGVFALGHTVLTVEGRHVPADSWRTDGPWQAGRRASLVL